MGRRIRNRMATQPATVVTSATGVESTTGVTVGATAPEAYGNIYPGGNVSYNAATEHVELQDVACRVNGNNSSGRRTPGGG